MTKAQHKALARSARQYGYFNTGTHIYVSCPLCRERVQTILVPVAYGKSVAVQLDAAMMEHSQFEH